MANIKAIQDQINKNSSDWHSADAATRKQLEQDNKELRSMLDKEQGTTSSFNPNSGKWTVTGGGTGGSSNNTPSGGGSSGSTGTTSTPGHVSGTDIPAGAKTQQYGGGDASLDAALKSWGDQYNAARASGDWQGMQRANEEANKIRNQYGYAAVFATDDINSVRNQYYGMDLGGGPASSGGNPPGGGSTVTPPVEDYTDLIEEMNKAAKEKALAELRAAFEKNVAGLDRTAASIAPQYQDARNQAAGASEQARRQFAEYAAATGLNSGAGGQGQLAINNALQGNLNELNTAEASSMADLELQRSQTETDYNNAIAQAEANGDYQLAQQLYQEKVRVDEAIRAQMIQQAQMQFQQQQLAWQQQQAGVANNQWNQQFQTGQEQQGWENKLSIAKMLAQYGDFSGYEALGIDTSQMKSAWEAQQALTSVQAQGGVRAGGGSGGGSGTGSPDYDGLYAAAYASQNPENYIASNYKNYGIKSASGLTDGYGDWRLSQADNGQRLYATNDFQTLVTYVKKMRDFGRSTAYMYDALKTQGYSDAVIDQIFVALGL